LPQPVGSRPVVILTRDAVLHSIDSVVVTLVTRTVRGLPTEVVLGRRQGLPARCVANLDNILTVPAIAWSVWLGRVMLRRSRSSIKPSRPRSTFR